MNATNRKLTAIGKHLKKILFSSTYRYISEQDKSLLAKQHLAERLSEFGIKALIQLHDLNIPFNSLREMDSLLIQIVKKNEVR